MHSNLPSFVPPTFGEATAHVAAVSPSMGVAHVGARLTELGVVVATGDPSPDASHRIEIDPATPLDDFSDEGLCDWWASDDGWVRRSIWAAAATGRVAAVDWMIWLTHLAEEGRASTFASMLASDLRDMTRVAHRVVHGSDPASATLGDRSPVRIFQWLQSGQIGIARTNDTVRRPVGSRMITAAWLHGAGAGVEDRFDALQQAALMGGAPIVVEFDHGFRRHVLVPVEPLDSDAMDADHYCVDLVCRRGGWFSRFGRWMWDDGPVAIVPPNQALDYRAYAGR